MIGDWGGDYGAAAETVNERLWRLGAKHMTFAFAQFCDPDGVRYWEDP